MIIGRLVSTSIQVMHGACHLARLDSVKFGALISVPIGPNGKIYGVITDVCIPNDEVIRQIAKGDEVGHNLLSDNRFNRIYPADIHTVVVGYREGDSIFHRLPKRPGTVLDPIELCDAGEVIQFCGKTDLTYLNLLVRQPEVALFDLLASHLELVEIAFMENGVSDWRDKALRKLNKLLADDPEMIIRLMTEV